MGRKRPHEMHTTAAVSLISCARNEALRAQCGHARQYVTMFIPFLCTFSVAVAELDITGILLSTVMYELSVIPQS